VALVGRSGAGKTTVTDLVARFHDPTRGRLLLNGSDIRDFRLHTYRDLLAIVQQDVFLFDGSVRDNIAYGGHDVTDAAIEDAARRTHHLRDRPPALHDPPRRPDPADGGGPRDRAWDARGADACAGYLLRDGPAADGVPRTGRRGAVALIEPPRGSPHGAWGF